MTERIGTLREHIDSVRELESVVNAMRAIAAARSREAREWNPVVLAGDRRGYCRCAPA
jgi:hypothetical protein